LKLIIIAHADAAISKDLSKRSGLPVWDINVRSF